MTKWTRGWGRGRPGPENRAYQHHQDRILSGREPEPSQFRMLLGTEGKLPRCFWRAVLLEAGISATVTLLPAKGHRTICSPGVFGGGLWVHDPPPTPLGNLDCKDWRRRSSCKSPTVNCDLDGARTRNPPPGHLRRCPVSPHKWRRLAPLANLGPLARRAAWRGDVYKMSSWNAPKKNKKGTN